MGDSVFKPTGRANARKDTEVTYGELAKRLKKHRLKEAEASIANKLARGHVSRNILSCLYCGARTGRGGLGRDLILKTGFNVT